VARDRDAKTVLVTGYFARGNLGDDVMLAGYLAGLRRLRPLDTATAVPLPPRGRSGLIQMPALCRAFRRSDSVTLVGGTHFHDAYGLRSIPILLSHLAFFGTARALGCRVGYAGIGVGPLRSRLARLLVRLILGSATSTLVRDPQSLHQVLRLHGSTNVSLGFDLAALLPELATPVRPVGLAPRVVVSIIPYHKTHGSDPSRDEVFAERLASALKAGLEPDATLNIVAFYQQGPRSDVAVSESLVRHLRTKGMTASLATPANVDECASLIAGADLVVATRYHAALLSFLAARPQIMIAYEQKCLSLASQIALGEHAVVPISVLSSDTALLADKIRSAIDEPEGFLGGLEVAAAQALAEQAMATFLSQISES
jgi:polysaccharide pyruvyl transferase WcaK-like protein